MIPMHLIHKSLRLDLLESHRVEQYPNKIFYRYPNEEVLPNRFLYKKFAEKIIIEKDLDANFLWFENSFFEEIKVFYQMCSSAHDDDFVKNNLETNFFQINESIGAENFNPSEFGNGLQIKIADEYARLSLNLLIMK